MNNQIDFVVTWVDGSDPSWLKKKAQYDESLDPMIVDMNSDKAYREWGTFKYWFRGVEKFAPWVHKVYLVTDNQKPDWLNLENEKLVIVDHRDIIDTDYLPVFSANPIESNIHKIPGLSEYFVFFNDDMYLTAPINEEDFFSDKGLPKYNTALSPIIAQRNGTAHFQVNDMEIVNSHFTRDEILNQAKLFHLKQGWKNIFKSFLYRNSQFICGFWESHLPYPLLKSTCQLVWEKERATLEKTSASRFRNPSDTNVWLFKYWQIASGEYEVGNRNLGKLYTLKHANLDFWNQILSQKFPISCINDDFDIEDETQVMSDFITVMEKIFPEKSQFEIY